MCYGLIFGSIIVDIGDFEKLKDEER